MSKLEEATKVLRARQLRYLAFTSTTVAVAGLLFSGLLYLIGGSQALPLSLGLLLLSFGSAFSMPLVRWLDSPVAGAHLFMGTYVAGLSVVAWFSGGMSSPATNALAFGGPMGVLILPIRGATLWVSVAIAELILFGVWNFMDLPIVNRLTAQENHLITWMGLITIVAILFLLLIQYQRALDEQVKTVTRSNRRLQDARQEVAAAHDAFASATLVVAGDSMGRGLIAQMNAQSNKGSSALRSARARIDSMFQSYTDIGSHVANLKERSDQIAEHLSTIKRISTKLDTMALNTALEAAHAKEHGENFAPLAHEMRRLSEAAISEIESIREDIRLVLSQSEEVGNAVTRSSGAAEDTRDQLLELETIFGEVLQLFRQSTRAAQEARDLGNQQLVTIEKLLDQDQADSDESAAS